MKRVVLALMLILSCIGVSFAQQAETVKIYDPSADASQQIKDAVARAAREKKHVLLQIGGNWCVWCMRFNKLVTEDTMLHRLSTENYITVHLNYSKENKNEKVLAQLGYPQRFGFPVFVILDAKGNRLHTQNSAYLEEGKGHSPEKVADFLKGWAPAALDPAQYKEKK
ncbi:thioredoxin family protein [Chitinophagaceae bacterium MMS25-I14]